MPSVGTRRALNGNREEREEMSKRRKMVRSVDRIGTKFGRWTVISLCRRSPGKTAVFKCRCGCGKESNIPYSNLHGGMSTQCRECGWASTGSTQIKKHAPRTKARAKKLGYKVIRMSGARPIVACRDCGQALGKYAVSQRTRRCCLCNGRFRRKYSRSLDEIAAMGGVTKQAVSLYIKAHGYAAAMRRYMKKGNP